MGFRVSQTRGNPRSKRGGWPRSDHPGKTPRPSALCSGHKASPQSRGPSEVSQRIDCVRKWLSFLGFGPQKMASAFLWVFFKNHTKRCPEKRETQVRARQVAGASHTFTWRIRITSKSGCLAESLARARLTICNSTTNWQAARDRSTFSLHSNSARSALWSIRCPSFDPPCLFRAK